MIIMIIIIIIIIMTEVLATENTGFEIATHWSPMRPKIECWRLDFQNWSPAGDTRFVRWPRINSSELLYNLNL